jgi:serine/threonine protein kinase
MTDRIGQRFGEYRLTCFLGRGSFGDVYLGEHLQDHTLAAVKVLQARLTNEDLKEFINEASTTFRLKHPHIVQLLDFGVGADDALFLVMAYAPNGTLRQCYPKGARLPLDTVVSYVNQIAEALQYAHDRKLIHRDVKPENILLGLNNELLLSDFGIAIVTHSSRSPGTQDNAGTIVYMAPEQIRGRPRPASDQYALGIIAYEWLCGARPFNGTATEIAMQHLLEPPPSLCEKVPTIPSGVEQVIMTALAKDPQQRFASVQAFARALAITAQPPSQTVTLDTDAVIGEAAGIAPVIDMAAPANRVRAPSILPSLDDDREKDHLSVPSRNNGRGSSFPHATKRPLWIALVAILLTLLAFGGLFLAFLGPLKNLIAGIVPAATISITPASTDLKNSYTIYGVTSTPDANQRQVQARLLTSSTSSRSKTVHTTATRTAGTQATGTLTFYNGEFKDQQVNGGTTFILASGVRIVTDRVVDVPSASPPPNSHASSASVSAHAAAIGPAGNIAALTIDSTCCSSDGSIFAKNLAAFTGGQDPQQGGPFVQQSDIDNASKSLENMLIPGAQQSLQAQVQPNEYFVNSPQCTPMITTDHNIGDKATSVTVTVKVTCSAEVYDRLGAQTIAANLLKQEAARNPGAGYLLTGNLVTAVTQVTVTDAQKGTLSLLVRAEGIWVFQFDDTQKQTLARLVAGKSRVDAQSLLLRHPGVASADIVIRSDENILTTDPYRISMVVQNVPGLLRPVSPATSP